MSEDIEYRGEYLGKMHWGKGKHHMLVFEGTAPLEKLLKLNSEETIMFGGAEITIEKFKSEWLPKIEAIYTSGKAYFTRETPFPFGYRVPDEILKKAGLVE